MHCVREGGFVYVELPVASEPLVPGEGWELWKDKKIGEVRMQVFRKVV